MSDFTRRKQPNSNNKKLEPEIEQMIEEKTKAFEEKMKKIVDEYKQEAEGGKSGTKGRK